VEQTEGCSVKLKKISAKKICKHWNTLTKDKGEIINVLFHL